MSQPIFDGPSAPAATSHKLPSWSVCGLIRPAGRIIDRHANFRRLTVLYFNPPRCTKGLADTALKTDSGYLTRRLADVVQDVIVRVKTAEPQGVGLSEYLTEDNGLEEVINRVI